MGKFKLAFLAAFFCVSGTMSAQAQKTTSNPPSDAQTGFTYDFDKALDLVKERIQFPTKKNEDAQILINDETFPKLKYGQSDAEYLKNVGTWIQENPYKVIEAFKARTEIVQRY